MRLHLYGLRVVEGGLMSDYLNYQDEIYSDLVAEYGEGITLAYHQANIAEMS